MRAVPHQRLLHWLYTLVVDLAVGPFVLGLGFWTSGLLGSWCLFALIGSSGNQNPPIESGRRGLTLPSAFSRCLRASRVPAATVVRGSGGAQVGQ